MSAEDRALDAEAPQAAVDLDGAAVAGAVAARHRRLPGELGARGEAAHRLAASARGRRRGRRSRARSASVTKVGSSTTSAFGTSAAASAWRASRKPSRAGGPAEALGEVREGRDPDAAADEQRALDVEAEAVAERAEDVDAPPRLERASARVPGPTGSMRKRELAGRARGRGSSAAGAAGRAA